MKISVITVCRNTEEILEKTLESVFSQTYKNIEYVIIDGASTDGTLGIIEKYRDKISYFVSEPDTGIYNAMNKGIKAATGDVLYFLNAGDTLYDENVFADIVEEFAKNKEADLIFGDLFFVSDVNTPEENLLTKPNRIGKSNNILLNLCLYHMTLPHQASFFRKELFDKCGGYREDLKLSSDYEFYLRILIKEKVLFKYTNRIVANFLLGGLGGLKSNKETKQKERVLILKNYPILNESNFRRYKFVVKRLYPFMLRNFRCIFRKYNKNIKTKEAVNRFIARFIGGHLNVIYDKDNTIIGRL